MSLLKTFAALALAAGAALTLLPEGSLRKTAALVIGLMLTLCWAEGLASLLRATDAAAWPDAPDTPLATTGVALDQAAGEAARNLAERLPEVTIAP